MSPGLTVVDGCVSWVPGTIGDISVVNLNKVSSTWGCGGGVVWSGGGSRSITWPGGGEV
jgi:hypothetical protein